MPTVTQPDRGGIDTVATTGDLPDPASITRPKIVYVEADDDYYAVFQE